MAAGGIEGAGLRGVMRVTWVSDHLAHVLNHGEMGEPPGAWTGLACPDHGLALGGAVDGATMRHLSVHGDLADLVWEAPEDLAAEHGRLVEAAHRAGRAGKPQTAERLWQQVQAIWSLAWSANYAALNLLQDAGLTRFGPAKPQRWVAASFEHHRGPHGLPAPHVHNIVFTALTT
jgi:TrwC relaxase